MMHGTIETVEDALKKSLAVMTTNLQTSLSELRHEVERLIPDVCGVCQVFEHPQLGVSLRVERKEAPTLWVPVPKRYLGL